MENILKKFEKDKVNMSQIYGGLTQQTGHMLWGSSTDMTIGGQEYAFFDNQGCCVRYFVPDGGGPTRILDPIC